MGKMSAEEMGILFGGISSILAVLIYFTKNIKRSKCCNTTCEQVVVDGHGNAITTPQKSVDCIQQAESTFSQQSLV